MDNSKFWANNIPYQTGDATKTNDEQQILDERKREALDPKISMRDKILAQLAQSGILGQADNALQQMELPPAQDFRALVQSLRNRPSQMAAEKPNMQPTRSLPQEMPMQPAAQATQQNAQQIQGQVNPAPTGEDDVEAAIKMRQFQKGFRGQ